MTSQASLPPGPRVPVSLQSVAWIMRGTQVMDACARRYGDTFTYRLARVGPLVFLSDPEDVKAVFTGSPKQLHAGAANVILEPVLGSESILLLDEDRHLRQRKLMLPAFHGERLQRYRDQMREVAEAELARWPRGSREPARPRMQSITLDIIMRTVFGVSDADRLARLRAALVNLLEWTTARRRLFLVAAVGPQRLTKSSVIGFLKARNAVDELVFEEIKQRQAATDLADRDDVLSMLVQARDEDGDPMTRVEIRDELMTLLVAGHETTATALAWAVEQLSRHPDVLTSLENGNGGNEEYIEAVVQETLRLRPVIVVVVRLLTEPMELGGRVLPAGVRVAPCIYLMHRRPEIYPDPEAFRPERFLESPPGTYTWLPFGGGIRRCLGAQFAQMEMKVVLQTLLAQARIRPTSARPERVTRRAITFVPERGGEVVLDEAA